MVITGVRRRTVQQWIAKYNRGRIVELLDKPRSGAPHKLPTSIEQHILQRIHAGPQQSDGVSVFSAVRQTKYDWP